MDRRDISKVLLGSVAGSALLSERAAAQTCAAPCYPQTAAEIAAGVTPTLFSYPPGDIRRYGAVADDSTNCQPAIQASVNQAQQNGAPAYIPGDHGASITGFGYRITTAISITSGIKIYGDGYARSILRCHGVNGFDIAAGVQHMEISGLRIASTTRHTVTPNTLKAINIQGMPASRCWLHVYRDLYIDGFETAIQANSTQDCVFDHVQSNYGKNFIFASGFVTACLVCNCTATGDRTGQGITMGDGIEASEGWQVTNNVLQSYEFSVVGHGMQNTIVTHNQFDFFGAAAVYIVSGASMASCNWVVANNYMACGKVGGDSGIILRNGVAASNPRGHRIVNNDILVYLFNGYTLSYGIRSDGTLENHNLVAGNNVVCSGGGGFDLRVDAGSTNMRVIGNEWRSTGANFASGVSPLYQDNLGPAAGIIPTVASAAALALPVGPKNFKISGTTNISSIVVTGHFDDTVGLTFSGILTITDGSNLKLHGNFVTSPDDSIVLWCDGTNWFERSRSVN